VRHHATVPARVRPLYPYALLTLALACTPSGDPGDTTTASSTTAAPEHTTTATTGDDPTTAVTEASTGEPAFTCEAAQPLVVPESGFFVDISDASGIRVDNFVPDPADTDPDQ
jgi:hypothetical protein